MSENEQEAPQISPVVQPPPRSEQRSAEELLQELQTYQIELEMQNERLRESQLELEKSRDRYVGFYDFAPVGYLTLNHHGVIVEANLTGAAMLGMDRQQLMNRRFAPFVDAQDSDRWHRHFISVLNKGNTHSGNFLIRPKNNEPFYIRLDSLSLKNDDDDALIRMVLTDITEQKKTEEQLLDSLRKQEEKERSKTRFLAAAGHDLRQPVTAAKLFVYALKHTHPNPQQSELIEKMDQSMNAFSDLLKQLLDISKFDAGVIKPQNMTFHLAELCDWLEQTFAQTAMEHHLKFHQFFSTNRSLLVHTDIGLLRSVLMNLVSNSIKFTAHGGILISARPREGQVLIQVWDTGIGIAKAHLPLVFDEFYQIANQQRNREAGLGLGLSICQRAVSLLGGKITCHSRPGHGSVFEFSLPLVDEKRQSERLPGDEPSTDMAGEIFKSGTRVVLIEDDELVAAGMLSLMRRFGAEVTHFYNAEDALKHDDLTDTHYFIVDYALGGKLNGIEFLESMQRRQLTPLRAVIVTGETSSQFISSVESCPWPVLHKPIDFAKLALTLHTHPDRLR